MIESEQNTVNGKFSRKKKHRGGGGISSKDLRPSQITNSLNKSLNK